MMSQQPLDKQLRDALRLKYQGEIAAAKANINVYMKQSVGIGEHPDIIGAIDEQLNLLTQAEEKLQAVEHHFTPDRVI
jgi:hypothetical protein|tara:strand:- start:5365 stop:5598 length:234 start_codon:yes stop_codon:yes gene_type:complete